MAGPTEVEPTSAARDTRTEGAPRTNRSSRRRRPLVTFVIGMTCMFAVVFFGWPKASRRLPAAVPVAAGVAEGSSVLLITVDTLRADHLRCYGNTAVQTPALDALAAGGVRFADAVTSVPMTLPSHASIFTGLYPPRHGVRDNGTGRLVDTFETLAERLKAEGYSTGAFIGAFVLEHRFGLSQGFQSYDDGPTAEPTGPGTPSGMPQRPGNEVVDNALAWLDQQHAEQPDSPFFLWVHLFDPHLPHTPPEPFKTRYAANLYNGEVAFTDLQVARLVKRLGELNKTESTLVVVIGDHGEGQGDHGETTHGLLIYESTMRVPFIIHQPGIIPAGVVVGDRVVATVDVMPTILDLLGLSAQEFDGMSLLRPADSDRAVYMETVSPQYNHGWSPLFGIRRHQDKFIEAPRPEYYDLVNDPGELNNLLAERLDVSKELIARLQSIQDIFLPEEELKDAAIELDAEARERLVALGYLGGAGKGRAGDGSQIDPKDMVARWEREFTRATELVISGNFEMAIPLSEQLLLTNRHNSRVWSLLSQALAQAERLEEALQCRKEAMRLRPNNPDHILPAVRLHFLLGERDVADDLLALAEQIEPDNGGIYLIRAEFARVAGDYEAAISECEKARERDPVRHTGTSWATQGKLLAEMGDLEKAVAAFQEAYQADPRNAGARLGLAAHAERSKEFERAVEWAQPIPRSQGEWVESRWVLVRALLALNRAGDAVEVLQNLTAVRPDDARAHQMLGSVLLTQGRHSEAAESYRKALALTPRDAKLFHNYGLVLREQGELDEAIRSLRSAVQLDPALHVSLLALARIHAQRGEIEQGLNCLRPMLKVGTLTGEQAREDTSLKALIEDPRFDELVESLPGP